MIYLLALLVGILVYLGTASVLWAVVAALLTVLVVYLVSSHSGRL